MTIEDAAELRLQQRHVIRLESRPSNIEGKGEVLARDLLRNALRMRPDRIVVGEVRGAEALDMLQAMNTGHDGSLSTLHANSPRDGLARVETMVLMAGFDLPVRAIREQSASAIDLLVHINRDRDGVRRVTRVSSVDGMEGDLVTLSDVFMFEGETGTDGKVAGSLRPTGVRPKLAERLHDAGIALPAELFDTAAAVVRHLDRVEVDDGRCARGTGFRLRRARHGALRPRHRRFLVGPALRVPRGVEELRDVDRAGREVAGAGGVARHHLLDVRRRRGGEGVPREAVRVGCVAQHDTEIDHARALHHVVGDPVALRLVWCILEADARRERDSHLAVVGDPVLRDDVFLPTRDHDADAERGVVGLFVPPCRAQDRRCR